jgi:hypothetical protein
MSLTFVPDPVTLFNAQQARDMRENIPQSHRTIMTLRAMFMAELMHSRLRYDAQCMDFDMCRVNCSPLETSTFMDELRALGYRVCWITTAGQRHFLSVDWKEHRVNEGSNSNEFWTAALPIRHSGK